jgi:REP element-mobilizing transposase RayT
LNEFVIMPNHIHGIIVLHGSGIVGANNDSPNADSTKTNNHTPQMIAQPQNPSTNDSANNDVPAIRANNHSPLRNCNGTTKTIGAIVRGYKIGVTKWYRANINIHELWQRNYWEHIIRDENELFRIRSYIKNNPINWERDKLNGENGNRVLEPAAPYGEETWMI